MKKKTIKRKNPNDSTFRNINSLKNRVSTLELGLKYCLHMLQSFPAKPGEGKITTYTWTGKIKGKRK